MTSTAQCDLSLYGDWPKTRIYDGAAAEGCAPETKSVPPQAVDASQAGTIHGPDALWRLLTEMTTEMREQFRFFRELREGADHALNDAEETLAKAARADAKAATDAMSLIVRTLEKIDTLQRQLARDREAAAESEAERRSYEDAVAYFERRIEALAEQKFRQRLAHAGLPAQERTDAGAE